nr:Immunoglobulin I-set domain containing protein [Haemonchus contortus]
MSDPHSFVFTFLLASVGYTVAADDPSDGAPVIIEHPLDVIVSKGSPATLNCAAKPQGTQITWYKDGHPVSTNKDQVNSHRIILDTGALFLLKVSSGKNGKDSDSGSYHCVARNKYGEARSREGTLKIAMLRDDFRIRPRTVQALSGDKAVLECSPPRGFPEPVVGWRKDDREVKLSEIPRMTLHPDGNLIIEPVEHGDSGTYQCVATNMVGERVSSPARLSVYEKPTFLVLLSRFTPVVMSMQRHDPVWFQ